MAIKIEGTIRMSVGDTEVVSIDCGPWLDEGETLTGTPTADETGGYTTIEDVQINTTVIRVKGKDVAVGQAMQFKIIGDVATPSGSMGTVTISTQTPERAIVRDIDLQVIG